MVEEIELKRKVFEVIENIGDHSKKVTRKGNTYFYKDFSSSPKEFDEYIDGYNKLKVSGIRVPKVYMYDKDKKIVITDYIEGPTVLDILLEKDLDDEYFEAIFLVNYFAKREKVSVDYYPSNYKFVNGKMWYLLMKVGKFDANKSIEKKDIWYWVYSKDFVRSIIQRHLPVDPKRSNINDGFINKTVALKVVKFYR